MILLPLSIRNLSRTLSFSRQWNKTVLDSVELQRTIFLEPPKQANEYLE
jgi:hypothetical protein